MLDKLKCRISFNYQFNCPYISYWNIGEIPYQCNTTSTYLCTLWLEFIVYILYVANTTAVMEVIGLQGRRLLLYRILLFIHCGKLLLLHVFTFIPRNTFAITKFYSIRMQKFAKNLHSCKTIHEKCECCPL